MDTLQPNKNGEMERSNMKYKVEVWHEFEIEAENYDDAMYKALDKIQNDAAIGAIDIEVEKVEEIKEERKERE